MDLKNDTAMVASVMRATLYIAAELELTPGTLLQVSGQSVPSHNAHTSTTLGSQNILALFAAKKKAQKKLILNIVKLLTKTNTYKFNKVRKSNFPQK